MLRLLLIDDSPNDRHLILHELRREFPDLQVEQIIEAEGFHHSVIAEEFDLVITDYQLRWTDGLTVLKTIKSHYPNCPVIMFTDSGNQEIAVAAMKAGLDDYIIKSVGNYTRLPVAIHAALNRVRSLKERQRAEAALYESEQRLQNILDCSSATIYIKDLQGRFTFVNRQALLLLNSSREQILNKTDYDFFPEELAAAFQANDSKILQSQAPYECEELVLKQGEMRTYLSLKFPLQNTAGEIYGICGISTDITERKQIEIAFKQQVEREQLFSSIAQRVRQSLDLKAVLNTTVNEVQQFLQTDRVIIYQLYPDRNGAVIAEAVTEGCNSILEKEFNNSLVTDNYISSYQEGKTWAVDDVYAAGLHPQYLHWMSNFQIRADLVVPILQGERLWGLLIAHHCSATRQWQPTEIDLLEKLAVQVAIAIQQSELYQQVQRLNSTLEHQVHERTIQLQQALGFEEVLKRITDKVRDSIDEAQILQTAVRELATALHVSSCNAAIYDLVKKTATIQYEYSTSTLSTKGRVLQISHFPELYDPLLRGQYFQYCPIINDPAQALTAKLACPIFDAEGALGNLWLTRSSNYIFSRQEIRLVQQVANQCAIAIRQARLYEAAQAQVAKLQSLNLLKDDFLSTVSHELRTPVTNMKMAIKMLKLAPNTEKMERYLEILQSECNREVDLINDLLSLQKLEASDEAIALDEAVHLQDWLPTIIESFKSRIQERYQILEVDVAEDLAPLMTNTGSLERILAELINNACKYTPANGKIVFSIRDYPSNGRTASTVLTIRNQAEIPAMELPHIFEKFYRVPSADPWKQGGTGLGLALVQKLIEQLRGTIQVESSSGWTTFTVKL